MHNELHFLPLKNIASDINYNMFSRLGLRPNYTAGNIGFRCARTVELPELKPKDITTTTQRPPKHHRYEDTWTYKVKQVVQEVFQNIKDSVKLEGEL